MGVRVTDEEHVALYDSVTGTAFGPLFDTKSQAEHFLSWHQKQYEKSEVFQHGHVLVEFAPDVRVYSDKMLEAVHSEWQKEYTEDA